MPLLTYGPSRQQVVDLTMPCGPGPHPVALVLHGGFWRARYKRKLMNGLCENLVERGWAAANVEYRRVGLLTGGGGGWRETTDDVGAALNHLATVAADHALDLSRVVPIGHSAGGHLALWVADPNRPGTRVRCAGVVGQAAITDLRRGDRLNLGGGIVRRFCGGDRNKAPEAYAHASPVQKLPYGIPQLLVHGTADPIVPPEFSELWHRAGLLAGDDVTLELREGEGHFEHIDATSGAWAAVTTWLMRFSG